LVVGGKGSYAIKGAAIGHSLGSAVDHGAKALKGVANLFGVGSYVDHDRHAKGIRAAASSMKRNTMTDFATVKVGGVSYGTSGPNRRFAHSEFLGPVMTPPASSTESFHVTTFDVNPGLARTFPWASESAAGYQEYRLHGAVVVFESTSTDFTANVALGDVIIASQYDTNAKPWDSLSQLRTAAMTSRGKPSQDLYHGIECDPAQTLLKNHVLRFDDSKVDRDELLYDWSKLYVGLNGVAKPAEPAQLGNLYLVFEVELFLPQIAPGLRLTRDQKRMTYRYNGSAVPAGSSFSLLGGDNPHLWAPKVAGGLELTPMATSTEPNEGWYTNTVNGFAFPLNTHATYLVLRTISTDNPSLGTIPTSTRGSAITIERDISLYGVGSSGGTHYQTLYGAINSALNGDYSNATDSSLTSNSNNAWYLYNVKASSKISEVAIMFGNPTTAAGVSTAAIAIDWLVIRMADSLFPVPSEADARIAELESAVARLTAGKASGYANTARANTPDCAKQPFLDAYVDDDVDAFRGLMEVNPEVGRRVLKEVRADFALAVLRSPPSETCSESGEVIEAPPLITQADMGAFMAWMARRKE
jgi:hypothetical protein